MPPTASYIAKKMLCAGQTISMSNYAMLTLLFVGLSTYVVVYVATVDKIIL